jgi:hypothetical protein
MAFFVFDTRNQSVQNATDAARMSRRSPITRRPAMSQDSSPSSPTVALFQKAHTKMVALQRIEEQFVNLQAQRRKLQDELRAIQGEINGEFDKLIDTTTTDSSPKVQLQISEDIAKRSSNRMRIEAETA